MDFAKQNSLAKKLAERKFRKWKAIKRNKEIFDIDQIDNYENIEQKKRRTPYKTLPTQMSDKFNQSFMNSTTAHSFKLNNQIQRHRSKVGSTFRNSNKSTRLIFDNYQNFQQKSTQAKGVTMDKMLTRQYWQSLEPKQNNNEMRFNNFQYMPTQQTKTRRFQKYLSREQIQKLHLQEVPESNPDIPIIYQKFFYPSNTFAVNWEYKKQKWDRGPKFFSIQTQNSINLKQIRSQSVQIGRASTQANWNKTLTSFKSFSAKENPAQFQRTFYSPNMNFRTKKAKQESVSKSIKPKFRVRVPEFERWELCDIKYFRLKTGKQKKFKRMKTQ